MQFIIDIDGTLCFNNPVVFFQLCNETFDLGMAPERFASMTRANFLAQPEVVALRAQLGAGLFAYKLGWLDFHPQAILAALPISGAAEGVARLADLGPVSYYTARFSHDAQRHAAIVSSTQQWLKTHRFVDPQRVVFCDGIQHKLRLLDRLAHDTGEHVVLVDDSYARLLASITSMADEERFTFLSLFTLMAARASELPSQTHGVHLLTLPHWRDVPYLIQSIQQKEILCP